MYLWLIIDPRFLDDCSTKNGEIRPINHSFFYLDSSSGASFSTRYPNTTASNKPDDTDDDDDLESGALVIKEEFPDSSVYTPVDQHPASPVSPSATCELFS